MLIRPAAPSGRLSASGVSSLIRDVTPGIVFKWPPAAFKVRAQAGASVSSLPEPTRGVVGKMPVVVPVVVPSASASASLIGSVSVSGVSISIVSENVVSVSVVSRQRRQRLCQRHPS